MLGYPVTPNYYWSIHNGNQIQIPLIQIACTYANTCKPVSDEIRTLWFKLYRLCCSHLEEILMYKLKGSWIVEWISNGITHAKCFHYELAAQQFCDDLYNECLIPASVRPI